MRFACAAVVLDDLFPGTSGMAATIAAPPLTFTEVRMTENSEWNTGTVRKNATVERLFAASLAASEAIEQVRREGAIEALRAAALDFEGMTDPPDPVNVETADWLRARAHREATR